MDAALKAQWVDALRSGRYEQGQGQLRREGKYDCIGVLADLVDPNGWMSCQPKDGMADRWHGHHQAYIGNAEARQLGILGRQIDLINKTDAGWSFDRLADHIEATF